MRVCVLHLPIFSFLRTKSNFLISKFNVTDDNDDTVKTESTHVQPAKANGDKTELEESERGKSVLKQKK